MGLFRRKITEKAVRRKGKRDGRSWRWSLASPVTFFRIEKARVPELDDTEGSIYEEELRERIESQIDDVEHAWSLEDQKLKPAFLSAVEEYRQAVASAEKESKEAEQARTQLTKAQESLQEIGEPHLSRGWCLAWLIFIGLAEYPLNSIIFQLFGERLLLTHILALGIAAAIPLLAHFFGKALRQEERGNVDAVFLIVSPLLVLVLLGVIGFLRAHILADQATATHLGVSFTIGQSNLLFMVLNLALYFAAVMVSYEGSHRHHGLYKSRLQRVKEARKQFLREHSESVQAAARLERAGQELVKQRAYRRERFKHYRERAEELAERYETFVLIYRNANVHVRDDGKVPPVFRQSPPPVSIPLVFQDSAPDEQFQRPEEALAQGGAA